MTCLECGAVFCGRYVKAHMLAHGESSGHNVVMGALDLSVWCYACDAYITHRHATLNHVYEACIHARDGTNHSDDSTMVSVADLHSKL